MKKASIILFIILFIILALLIAEPSFASSYQLKNPIEHITGGLPTSGGVAAFIGKIIQVIIGILGAAALLMFIYGGITLLSSTGSTDKITKGKHILIWATIGLVLVVFSFTIIDFTILALTGESVPVSGGSSPPPQPPPTSTITCSGTCIEKTTAASCDKLTPPQVPGSGDCESTDYICCQEPVDNCAGKCVEKTAADCVSLSPAMITVPSGTCEGSKLKNPGVEFLCCQEPENTCASPATCIEKPAAAADCAGINPALTTASGDCAGSLYQTGKDHLCCQEPVDTCASPGSCIENPTSAPNCEGIDPIYKTVSGNCAGTTYQTSKDHLCCETLPDPNEDCIKFVKSLTGGHEYAECRDTGCPDPIPNAANTCSMKYSCEEYSCKGAQPTLCIYRNVSLSLEDMKKPEAIICDGGKWCCYRPATLNCNPYCLLP